MAETLGAASELAAVNELLATIGEDPVELLDDLPPSGNTALEVLRNQSRDLQEEGHWFNRETVTLAPNVDNEIVLPNNVLDIDGTESDVIQVGGKLYDREAKSFTFAASVECDVTYHRPWAELPSVARRYITALAVERFVEGFPGADATSASRQRNLQRALVAFRKAEVRNGDYNLIQNTSVQSILRR